MNIIECLKNPSLLIGIFSLIFIFPLMLKAQSIYKNVPAEIDVKAHYLIFLHGQIVENLGTRPTSPQFGVYEYQKILEAFKDKGFVVISEARPKNTDVWKYAQKVKAQVTKLIQAGVPPSNITIVGASKGGVIATLASGSLKNKELNFVLIACCNQRFMQSLFERGFYLWGNVLSIYDTSDQWAGSCQKLFEASSNHGLSRHKEIKLSLGLAHGFHFRPLPEWVEPVIAWAKSQK